MIEDPSPVRFVVPPLSFVLCSIRPRLLAVPVSESTKPLSTVNSSVLKCIFTFFVNKFRGLYLLPRFFIIIVLLLFLFIFICFSNFFIFLLVFLVARQATTTFRFPPSNDFDFVTESPWITCAESPALSEDYTRMRSIHAYSPLVHIFTLLELHGNLLLHPMCVFEVLSISLVNTFKLAMIVLLC